MPEVPFISRGSEASSEISLTTLEKPDQSVIEFAIGLLIELEKVLKKVDESEKFKKSRRVIITFLLLFDLLGVICLGSEGNRLAHTIELDSDASVLDPYDLAKIRVQLKNDPKKFIDLLIKIRSGAIEGLHAGDQVSSNFTLPTKTELRFDRDPQVLWVSPSLVTELNQATKISLDPNLPLSIRTQVSSYESDEGEVVYEVFTVSQAKVIASDSVTIYRTIFLATKPPITFTHLYVLNWNSGSSPQVGSKSLDNDPKFDAMVEKLKRECLQASVQK